MKRRRPRPLLPVLRPCIGGGFAFDASRRSQGRITPLEIGLHQLGSGLTVRDYAAKD
jgi:hypothetical protein